MTLQEALWIMLDSQVSESAWTMLFAASLW